MSSRARRETTPTGDKQLSSDNHGKDNPFTLVQLFSEKLIEEIMFRYLELCVDLKKSHVAKEGLFQYRNMCQVDFRLLTLLQIFSSYLGFSWPSLTLLLEHERCEPSCCCPRLSHYGGEENRSCQAGSDWQGDEIYLFHCSISNDLAWPIFW